MTSTALAAMYDRHGAAAFAYALRITGDRTRAEDAVEAAFLEVWRGAGDASLVEADARTTILVLVHRRCIALLRERAVAVAATPHAAAQLATA